MKISLERFVPKHHTPDSVDFAEMQSKFSNNRWKKTPSKKMLQNSDDAILYRHYTADSCFTILRSGYVIADYQHADKTRYTIIPAQKSGFYYPIESGTPQRIPVDNYSRMTCLNALEMLLMFRIDKNANERERTRKPYYIDSSGQCNQKKERPVKKLSPTARTFEDFMLDCLEPDTVPDYRTRCKIALANSLNHLTDKQLEVLNLHFAKNLTQQEIADFLGLSRTTVQDRLTGAIKKLKKLCII